MPLTMCLHHIVCVLSLSLQSSFKIAFLTIKSQQHSIKDIPLPLLYTISVYALLVCAQLNIHIRCIEVYYSVK